MGLVPTLSYGVPNRIRGRTQPIPGEFADELSHESEALHSLSQAGDCERIVYVVFLHIRFVGLVHSAHFDVFNVFYLEVLRGLLLDSRADQKMSTKLSK